MSTLAYFRRLVIVPASFALIAGCDSAPNEPETSWAGVIALSPLQVTGTAGELADPAPHVRVVDERGLPLPFVRVRFQVWSGILEHADSMTDANGEARARWLLTRTALPSLLQVTLPGRDGTISFSAVVKPGAPDAIRRWDYGNVDQVAFAGESVTGAAVRVVDRFGNPTPNVAVVFAVARGGGHLGGQQSLSQSVLDNGVAALPAAWTLVQPGLNQLVVTLPGKDGVRFDIFAIDSARVTWYLMQASGDRLQKLALDPGGYFIHETWVSTGPVRFTGSYSVSSNKIVLNGCWLSVWDIGDLWCNAWTGDVGDGSIVLNARTFLKQ